MSKKFKILSISITILAMVFAALSVLASQDLDEIIIDIREDFDVKHMTNAEFDRLQSETSIVFDVRRNDEYKVSHIENAIRLDPGTSPDEFFEQYQEQLIDKTLVFYCSVGQRSSVMLSRLQNRLNELGIGEAYNLEGGAFARHNDHRVLVSQGAATRHIHPYNKYYGQLIDDKDGIRYE